MEEQELLQTLANTFCADATLRKAAEAQLLQFNSAPAFPVYLLRLSAAEGADPQCRLAGSIYLKNLVVKYWRPRADPTVFCISDDDKAVIRSNIISAVVSVSDNRQREMLLLVLVEVFNQDFCKGLFNESVDQLTTLLSEHANNVTVLPSVLLCVYQLIKAFKYSQNRSALFNALAVLLPPLLAVTSAHMDNSLEHAYLHHTAIKIIYGALQFDLPECLAQQDMLDAWVQLCLRIVAMPIPEQVLCDHEHDLACVTETPWAKAQKWSAAVIERLFERYGHEGMCEDCYQGFAKEFPLRYSESIVNTFMGVLTASRNGAYLSPRVLHKILSYLKNAITHKVPWQLLRPNLNSLIMQIIWPLFASSHESMELFHDDPVEYIRSRFDVYNDLRDPVTAATAFVAELVRTRRKHSLGMLIQLIQTTLTQCLNMEDYSVMCEGEDQLTGLQRFDAALHLCGVLSNDIVKLNRKDQPGLVDFFFSTFVTPLLTGTHPAGRDHAILRFRACFVAQRFLGESAFKNRQVYEECVLATLNRGLDVHETLPVRMVAFMAIQMSTSQPLSKQIILDRIEAIILELLNLTRAIECDELPSVLTCLLREYALQLGGLVPRILQSLSTLLVEVVDQGVGPEDDPEGARGMLVGSLLNSVSVLLCASERTAEFIFSVAPILAPVFHAFLGHHSVSDFMDDFAAILDDLVSPLDEGENNIPPVLWEVATTMIQFMLKDETAFLYFQEVEPILEQYVDRASGVFKENAEVCEMFFGLIQAMLASEDESSDGSMAARACMLMEHFMFHVGNEGHMSRYFGPMIELVAEAALGTDDKHINYSDWCLQVLIDALYADPIAAITVFEQIHPFGQQTSLTSLFLTQWLQKLDRFTVFRDMKINVLALSRLMETDVATLPGAVQSAWSYALPVVIRMFTEIRVIQEKKTEVLQELSRMDDEAEQDTTAEERDVPDDYEDLSDEEVYQDQNHKDYIEFLASKIRSAAPHDEFGDDDDDEDDDAIFENALPDIDEFIFFADRFNALRERSPEAYALLTQQVDADAGQCETLSSILAEADHRRQVKQSEELAQTGFQFNPAAPLNMSFGASNPFPQ